MYQLNNLHNFHAANVAQDAYTLIDEFSKRVEDPHKQILAPAVVLVCYCKELGVDPREILNIAGRYAAARKEGDKEMVFSALYDYLRNEILKEVM